MTCCIYIDQHVLTYHGCSDGLGNYSKWVTSPQSKQYLGRNEVWLPYFYYQVQLFPSNGVLHDAKHVARCLHHRMRIKFRLVTSTAIQSSRLARCLSCLSPFRRLLFLAHCSCFSGAGFPVRGRVLVAAAASCNCRAWQRPLAHRLERNQRSSCCLLASHEHSLRVVQEPHWPLHAHGPNTTAEVLGNLPVFKQTWSDVDQLTLARCCGC